MLKLLDDFVVEFDPDIIDDVIEEMLDCGETYIILKEFLEGHLDSNSLYETLYERAWMIERDIRRKRREDGEDGAYYE